jgi:predicted dienelactone hydrolase
MTKKTRGEAKLSHVIEPDSGEWKRVGVRAEYAATFEDATWRDEKRDRDVPVRIYAPKDAEGRLPALVFSHGGGESREAFTYLGSHFARHGYLAVFLTHPGSDRATIDASGKTGLAAMAALDGIGKFHRRPEDVRFVLDRLLSEDPGSTLLAGRVDSDRLAVAGQCAGATTALAMVGLRATLPEGEDLTFLDPRFKCAVALSPQPRFRRYR